MPHLNPHHHPTQRSRKLLSSIFLLAMLLALTIQPVLAQTYRFQVLEELADVYVNEDGTVSIAYTYVFQNSTSADPIDAIDIGVPTTNYDLGSVSAQIDGKSISNITTSPYVDPGVAIELGQDAIRPGATGTLTVQIGTIKNMIFKASAQEAEAYASFQYEPNFFGSDFVTGTTQMTVTLHLPAGLAESEPRYFTPKSWPGNDAPDETGYDDQDRVYYRWISANASASDQYIFGASFPARLVPAAVLMTETPFKLDMDTLCPWIFCFGFVGFMGFTTYASIVGDRKRRLQYLPPKLSVEGNGIKRGLTAVEAAIVMQQPMDRILTMILFSAVKKGAATVIDRSPMKLQVTNPPPEGLMGYETDFLEAMSADKTSIQRTRLQTTMTNLVKSVSEKMRGFSRKETEAYYKSIIEKAWQQVDAADTPEVKMKNFDEAMDWTMLDRNFDERTRTTFGPRPVIVPIWWNRFDPSVGRASAGAPSINVPSSGNNPPGGINLPSIPGGEFAASMVTGMQTFASNVVGDLTSFTGGVTAKTNPVPKSTSSSSSRRGGGGGGRSCACACACAGCACACAGGGR